MRLRTGLLLIVIVTTFVFPPGVVLGDEPLRPPHEKRVCSNERSYCAHFSPRDRIIRVFRTDGDTAHRVWSMIGWFRVAFLSDDGDHLVVGYKGQNLLPKHPPEDLVLIYFLKRGRLIRTVRLDQVVSNRSSLEPTVSHLRWGNYLGFHDTHTFQIRTVEDRLISYDVRTGRKIASEPYEPSETNKE